MMDELLVVPKVFANTKDYTQLPERLTKLYGEDYKKNDEFGVIDRFIVIKEVLRETPLGNMADLGGHSGYFSLSFVDEGMASFSTVYDLNEKALEMGKKMSGALGLSEKVIFIEQGISLDFIKNMEPVDTVICLNLIHHAGMLFDVDVVSSMGWDEYARQWLTALRNKCNLLIFGVGFKGSKPPYWNVKKYERPARLYSIAQESGWSIVYDANVYDIRHYGASYADGRWTKGMRIKRQILYSFRRLSLLFNKTIGDKTHRYHLYIMKK